MPETKHEVTQGTADTLVVSLHNELRDTSIRILVGGHFLEAERLSRAAASAMNTVLTTLGR
ncbi:hypothetical protein LCGC14_1184540 [marine sediment metagenome]|uniref:Uncharacterized protein n=1 Tax=marine sediment metagenome TaxID=412755 RepID=A0A0F9LQZ2_9ZZZZ